MSAGGGFSRQCAELMKLVACRVCDPQVGRSRRSGGQIVGLSCPLSGLSLLSGELWNGVVIWNGSIPSVPC